MALKNLSSLVALGGLVLNCASQASPLSQAKTVQDVVKLNQADLLRCVEQEGIISISRHYILSLLRVISTDPSVSKQDREDAEEYLDDLEEKSAKKGLNSDLSSRTRLTWLKASILVSKHAKLTNTENGKELTEQLQEYKETLAELTAGMSDQKKAKVKNQKINSKKGAAATKSQDNNAPKGKQVRQQKDKAEVNDD